METNDDSDDKRLSIDQVINEKHTLFLLVTYDSGQTNSQFPNSSQEYEM